jgi:hypothetical protein
MNKISSNVTPHPTIKLETDEDWIFSPAADWPKLEVDKVISRFSKLTFHIYKKFSNFIERCILNQTSLLISSGLDLAADWPNVELMKLGKNWTNLKLWNL